MPWNALTDRILTGSKRKKILEVENQSEYDQWVSELFSEIGVFVKRVNDLDLSQAEDRAQFDNFAEKFSDRLLELRKRSESSSAPTETLIQLEELVEKIDETSSQMAFTSVYCGDDPFEKARLEKKRKEREGENTERAREKRDALADEIQELITTFEGTGS
ncbi:hypothetical protein [Halococcoides cellulosivorans]|uniref:Uncharacterized protein n=1 Tax=Halococcoides cellulosivorans TaxID=1679096 RepID=A0A2R4X3I3_9EURY|nr:hypothetical protein [Halococcoides cellulosivorans]AWB28360.1 hypothetical protein HARCEL1_11905 [Halococcoides cellulosivorans]